MTRFRRLANLCCLQLRAARATSTAGCVEYKDDNFWRRRLSAYNSAFSKILDCISLNTAMDQITHFRQTLNNFLQGTYRGDPRRWLTWETLNEGSDNRPTWLAIAYLGGVEWGRGRGLSVGAAKEVAAERVLIALGVQL